MPFLFIVIVSFLVSLSCTFWVRTLALRFSILDIPDEKRKKHHRPTPLLGGVALFLTCTVVSGAYFFLAPSTWPQLFDTHVHIEQIIGFLIGGFFLTIGGVLDDKYNLSPKYQIVFPVLAALSVIFSGSDVPYIRNPFAFGGELIGLHQIDVHLFSINGFPFVVSLWSDILSFMWLMGVMYTTKILDGLDGLVAGMSGIGSLIIALISFFVFVNIPTGLLALIIFGASVGFLCLNFHPAKIFLGESGATLCGYFLGVLSIISGAKLATGLLILGIPILDLIWVIFQRIFFDRRIPFVGGDRRHLHFRLLELGLTQRQAVLLLYGLSLLFGLMALFFQNAQKFGALALLVCVMVLLAGITFKKRKSE